MYLGSQASVYTSAMSDSPNLSEPNPWTQAQIDNWIAWQGAQPIEVSFGSAIAVASGAKTWGEYWRMSNTPADGLTRLAIHALNQDAFKQSVGVDVDAEYNNPNWPQLTAQRAAAAEAERIRVANTPSPFTIGPGPAPSGGTPSKPIVPTTGITAGTPATREAVVAAFRNTPGANPQPDEGAITYYMKQGVAKLLADVATVRRTNPTLAAQIDKQRAAMGLPTAATALTTKPAGGATALPLILAAAAAYFLGS